MVGVRKPPASFLKGRSPYSEPLHVIESMGRWNYKLSDGQTWNARRMIKHHPPTPSFKDIEEEFMRNKSSQVDLPRQINPGPLIPDQQVQRSSRPNKGQPPARLIEQI
ncbi:MAG: hypothetical protein GY696_29520 [Gammaproteobacteria bacterium]|nr:hypothetical protein [Gammaproteobacteria bacterium]